MADFSEEIAQRIAERRARHRYWPHGEPGSRHGSDRSKGRSKSDPSEKKASTDSRFKPKAKAEEKSESISEFVKRERTRRLERAMKAMEERRSVPKETSLKKWLSDPENFKRAIKRGMIKRIAKHANPKSKDTDDVVTVGGSRYAKTDLYRAPLREKASEIVLKTKYGSEMWWDRNKKIVFVAAVSLVVGFMAYTVWKNKELQQQNTARLRRRRAIASHPAAQHAGLLAIPHGHHVQVPLHHEPLHPLSVPAHHWHGLQFAPTRFSDYRGWPYAEWNNWSDDWWDLDDTYDAADPYAYWW